MAKFCTMCGKPLEEGEICSCQLSNQTAQAPQQEILPQQMPAGQPAAQPTVQINVDNASNYIKKVFTYFKKIFCAPATDGAMFAVSQDKNTAFGILGAQAIFSALFALIATSKVGSLLKMVSSVKMPYVRIFIVTLLASFALSCAYAGILLGISILFKNKISFSAALCATATRSIALVPVTIAAIVLVFINFGYGIILFYLGNLAGLCYLVITFPITSQENKNKVAFIVFISTVIFAIVSMFIMVKCAPYYLPDSVKDSISSATNMLKNPSSFFEGIMNEMY